MHSSSNLFRAEHFGRGHTNGERRLKKANRLSVFTWNVGNPSLERAIRQSEWLGTLDHDIIVLTEVKESAGCRYLNNFYKEGNYNVIFPEPQFKEYGTMVISKNYLQMEDLSKSNQLESRAVLASFNFNAMQYLLLGIYVPSNDRMPLKQAKKRNFLTKIEGVLKKYTSTNLILAGDLNTVDRKHVPAYTIFKDWEYRFFDILQEVNMVDCFSLLNPKQQGYTWVGRTGNGYRYDYCFISSRLKNEITDCFCDETPVKLKLSDHLAVTTILG